MSFANMTVRAKLGAGFGALALVVLAVSALSLRALGASHDDFSTYVNEDAEHITIANDVLDGANARAMSARNMVLVTSDTDRAAEKAAAVKAHDKVQASIVKLKASLAKHAGIDERERKLFAEIESAELKYGPVALRIVELASTGKHDQAITMMNAECRPLLTALLKSADAYIAYASSQSVEDIKQSELAYATNRNQLLAACALALVGATALALGITRSLTRALGAEPGELGAVAGRVASGDLSPLGGAAKAPRGSVLASLSEMQSSLARVVGQVRVASDSIATGSSQIATGNADLSQRTEEQASNLQQTAASMEQMNATVKNNADTARQASQLASSASAAVQQGGEIVGRVVTTMEDITASSKRISDIIGVIDGIAFQTNILALNAAVEAARAGEQGRGFAVVASEVRSLAQRSAEAAKEIKNLIGASVEKVEQGSRLVGDAGTTMTDVVNQVRRVADLIGEISSATLEQTSGIGQVNDAVTQLDQVTQQNAALVEESAAAAESLNQQAAKLAELVSVFRLDRAAA